MKDPVIKILLCALAVNVIFMFKDGDLTETVGIAVSIFLATFISTASEHGSAAALERLSAESADKTCRVRRRDGESEKGSVREIPVTELAVGDVVLLSAGERIPADGIMLWGKIGVDQSGLTGESKELQKFPSGGFREDTGASGCVSAAALWCRARERWRSAVWVTQAFSEKYPVRYRPRHGKVRSRSDFQSLRDR